MPALAMFSGRSVGPRSLRSVVGGSAVKGTSRQWRITIASASDLRSECDIGRTHVQSLKPGGIDRAWDTDDVSPNCGGVRIYLPYLAILIFAILR